MRPPEEKKPWITAPELARWADVSPMTARTWIKAYNLGRKLGGRWRADEAITREFLTKAEVRLAGRINDERASDRRR
jgi:hypothetical protein